MLREIWKTFNVSLVMVLPIFWKITDNVFSKREKIKYPFIQLALEYGLLNTYLLRDDKFNNKLYLLFDKEKFSTNKNITLSKYFSICELLVDCEYFSSIQISNDYVVVGLNIPDIYEDDIEKVLAGSYSSLSKDYKNELCFRKKISHYPDGESKYAAYIMANDLPYAIALKDVDLREELREIIGYQNYIDEYFPSPASGSESISENIINSPKEIHKLKNVKI